MRDAHTGRPLFNDVLRLDRSRLRLLAPLRVAIVATGLVLACLGTDHREDVVPLVIGAVFAAAADLGEQPGQRWRTMLWTTTSLALATELGGFFSGRHILTFVVTIAVAAVCGFAGALSSRAGLIGVLSLVVFCAFSGAPSGMRATEINVLLIALGGLVITAVTVVPYLARHWSVLAVAAPDALTGPRDVWSRFCDCCVPSNRFFWHAIRLPVGIGIATLIAWNVPVMHAYWIPVTVAWVTLPDSRLTSVKVVARIVGTMAGALAAAVMLLPWMNQGLLAACVVGLGAYLTVAFLFAFYAVAVAGITMVILGIFSVVGDSILADIVVRIIATVVAAGIVVLVTLAWSKAEQRRHVDPA
jgi:uncharacterized membrane protein YccC